MWKGMVFQKVCINTVNEIFLLSAFFNALWAAALQLRNTREQIDPQGLALITTRNDHYIHLCCPAIAANFQNQNHVKTLLVGRTVGLAEWIIAVSCLVPFFPFYWPFMKRGGCNFPVRIASKKGITSIPPSLVTGEVDERRTLKA